MTDAKLTVNGRDLRLSGEDPNITLLQLLRKRGLTGTKEGCGEGECGACAVVVVRKDDEGPARYETVNSCLVVAPAVLDCEVWTVEGMADGARLHPVQEALAQQGGSQCGYCTPGFVASMFSEYYRSGREGADLEAIGGNLCRCTGYRPIRDALLSLGMPSSDDRFESRLGAPAPELEAVAYHAHGRRFYRPSTLEDALHLLRTEPHARAIAGGTDMVVEMNQEGTRFETLVSLEGVQALRRIDVGREMIEIGACASLSSIESELRGRVPILDQLWPLFSSRLIRNRATLGGNLVNASPIGDGAPALLALDAEVRLRAKGGERIVPLSSFFVGYRQTVLEPGEVLVSVRVPASEPTHSRFYKVSKREMDDISTVAAGFALDMDQGGTVLRARLAYGGVAATPVRAHDAEQALEGRDWDADAIGDAREHLERAFTPMSDHRGSAAYRNAMVVRLFDKLCAEIAEGGAA